MGTEEDVELLNEQKKKEEGKVEEDRKKGKKGWRYGAVSLHCYSSCFVTSEIDEEELTREIVSRSTP
jgi:hypothetical protein